MGRTDQRNSNKGKSRKKSKGRMSYLQRCRAEGEKVIEPKVDEAGQLYGDYVAVDYDRKNQRQQSWDRKGSKFNKRRREWLKSGMTGFLCTTNLKEHICVREAYNILNEYHCDDDINQDRANPDVPHSLGEVGIESLPACGSAIEKETSKTCEVEGEQQKIIPNKSDEAMEEKPMQTITSTTAEVSTATSAGKDKMKAERENDDEKIDIDEELSNELKDLKSENSVRKFQSVDTGVNRICFISTTIPNPCELASRIFDDVVANKVVKSRSINRFLPIELTCYANNPDEVNRNLKDLLEKHFKKENFFVSYAVVFNSRLNDKLKKGDIINSIGEMVSKMNPLSFVDLNNAQLTIVIEVLKTIMCVGIVGNFHKYRKYNLFEAAKPDCPKEESKIKKENMQTSSTSMDESGDKETNVDQEPKPVGVDDKMAE